MVLKDACYWVLGLGSQGFRIQDTGGGYGLGFSAFYRRLESPVALSVFRKGPFKGSDTGPGELPILFWGFLIMSIGKYTPKPHYNCKGPCIMCSGFEGSWDLRSRLMV